MDVPSLGMKVVDVEFRPNYDYVFDMSSAAHARFVLPDLNDLPKLAAWITCIYDASSLFELIPVYLDAILLAIQQNNLPALEYLWQGVYMDEDCPEYTEVLYLAAEYGNLTTWLHVLYARTHYVVVDPNLPISLDELKKIVRDPEVAKWIYEHEDDLLNLIEWENSVN